MIEQEITSYRQIDFTLEGAYKAVERAARICYNSTDKITNDSYTSFIEMLRKNKHTAPFAFGTIHLYFPAHTMVAYGKKYRNKITGKTIYTHSWDILDFFDKLPDNWARVYTIDYDAYVTANLRVLEEWEIENNADSEYPLGFTNNGEPVYGKVQDKYDLLDVVKPYMTNGYRDRFESRPFIICTTSIAMSREFNRYSSLSICERSSRYVKANQIVRPCWFGNDDKNDWAFEDTANIIYDAYYDLMNSGHTVLKKQEARDILPLCTATEVAYIGFQDDWNWIIYQRTDNGAHPQAQELARMIKREVLQC